MSPVGNLWVCGCVMTDEGRLWCNKRHVCICLKTQEFGGCKGLRDDLVWILVLFSFYRWLRDGTASSHSASWSPDSSASLTCTAKANQVQVNSAVEFRQCLLAPPGLGLTEEDKGEVLERQKCMFMAKD